MKLLVVLFIMYAVVDCAIFRIQNATDAAHPGKCVIKKTTPPIVLNPGDTETLPGSCERAICERQLNVEIHTCGIFSVAKGCTKTEPNNNKPYPECCPRLKCK